MYSNAPSDFASVLALLVEARQATIVWGPPGCAKSAIAQQIVAAAMLLAVLRVFDANESLSAQHIRAWSEKFRR